MDMWAQGIYPKVIPVEVIQDFSAQSDSKDAARARFRIQKKDLRIFYKKNPILYYYITIKKHLRLVIKYKDIKICDSRRIVCVMCYEPCNQQL